MYYNLGKNGEQVKVRGYEMTPHQVMVAYELGKWSAKQNTARTDGGVKYSLNEYSKHQRENWKNSKRIVLYKSDSQFTNFINNALSDKQFDKKMYFGTVASDFASAIKRSTDIDVSGYNCSLSTNEIRKIF